MSQFRKIIRILWPLTGLTFTLWFAYSMQSRGLPDTVLHSNEHLSVSNKTEMISFIPKGETTVPNFIFFPGGLVDPKAYTPMARTLAEQGIPVYILKLPFRTAITAEQEKQLMSNTLALIEAHPNQQWVIGGHSRGAALAARFTHQYSNSLAGLILIGTSHPKEESFNLSTDTIPVMKIYGSEDGLASVSEVEGNAHLLPAHTEWIKIDGGNHAQFGYYGAQLGDGTATISRQVQQEVLLKALISFLLPADD